ncbi:MAG: hypothetical protein WC747_00715 [Candidatus Babeliales bacterium]|jgi:hypothetical protein
MKKILLALALISASQTIPFSIGIGGGPYYGGYYGGPYGGYGYGPGYWGPGYGYGGVAFAPRPKSDAEVAADERVRQAREETRDKENQRKEISKQIKRLDKDIRLSRRNGDIETVKMLEKQQADLRKELANV